MHCGTISCEVFMRCVVECEKRRVDWSDQIIRVMSKIDVGGKGYICADDLRFVSREMGLGLSEKDVGDMIELADVKGDGVVDKCAFVDVIMQTNLFAR